MLTTLNETLQPAAKRMKNFGITKEEERGVFDIVYKVLHVFFFVI